MLKLDDLRNAVDLYSGSVQFSVPLATLPGVNSSGYTLQLAYDSGVVDETRSNWNLSHPTGVAGLGWLLSTDRISADYGDALGSDQALADPTLTLRLGGNRYALVKTGTASGQVTFAAEPYQFWKIAYTPGTETWTVVLEDGSTLTFGDQSSGRATVDWGYAWGNWIGASVGATNRVRVATGWSLSQTADLWGNGFAFTYTQTTANLAGDSTAPYTQATYLSTVAGTQGGSLTLTYGDKLPDEYQNPHGGADATAWQSHYATKVLTAVTQKAIGGDTLAVTALDYAASGGGVEHIGTGNLTKRLLMGVTLQVPNGYDVPGLRFTYDENATSDSYGALQTVTTPAGGVAAFTYSRPALTLPKRDQTVTAPVKQGVTYSTPRFFFGRDYTVVLWRGSDNTAAATVYGWDGRWLPASVVAPTAADENAYNQLQVALGDQCFAIVGATDYTVFQVSPTTPGAWVGSSAPEPTGLPSGEPVAVAAGSGYVALLATRSGTMVVRWFDGADWQTLQCAGPAGTQMAALDGAPAVVVRVSSTGTGSTHDVLLVQPDVTRGWVARTFRIQRWVSAMDGIAVRAGATYAVVTFTGWAGPDRVSVYRSLWWSADTDTLQSIDLGQVTSSAPPTVQLRGATVLIGQNVYRFDGQTWRSQDLSLLTHTDQQQVMGLTLGADAVTRNVKLNDNSIVYDLITYNAADTSATPWAYAPNKNGVPAKTGTVSATMAAYFGPGNPAAASRFVLFNNQLDLQGGDGTWSQILDIEATFTADSIKSLLVFADTYLVYQSANSTMAYPLRGGGLAADGGISLSNAQILATGGQALAGETAFVAYTGTWGQPGVAMTLYRPVTGDVRNALTPLVAQSVTLYGNGVPTMPGPLPYGAVPSAYAYDGATATVTPCGYRMGANKATLVPGASTPTGGANGSEVSGFFNGLTPTETPAVAYPTGTDLTNLAPLKGIPYAGMTYAQGQATVASQSLNWWLITAVRANARSLSSYIRCQKTSGTLDSVPTEQTMTYSAQTGLVTQVNATTADGQPAHTQYTYWWEVYDQQRTANLLAPVVQTMQYVNSALVGGSVTTWANDWGTGDQEWAPRATYLATKANPAAFTTWTGTPNPVPDGWALSDQIAARTALGTVQQTGDALGQVGSSLIGTDGWRQVASFANANLLGQEAYYYGFETYEDPGPWQYRGGTIDQHLVPGEANLGSRSLEIAVDATGQTGPVSTWVPTGQNRAYLFACWVQTSANFGSVSGAAQFDISIYTVANPPQQVGSTIALPFPATNGTWQYISAVIPMGALRTQYAIPAATRTSITVFGHNQKTGTQVLVDGLKFQPLDADFFAEVFDPGTGLALGSLVPNGGTVHLIRDANRTVTATLGPDPSVARLSEPSFARLLTTDGTYSEILPNSRLEASAASAAIYENFEASDAGGWTLPSGWSMANGKLSFTGTGTAPRGSKATLNGFTNGNYVARVRFLPPGAGSPNVGIGCGNVLVYYDNQTKVWVLSYTDGAQWTNLAIRSAPLGRGDLVFAILDGRVTFFAAGRQIFSQVLPTGITADGTLSLYLTSDGAFTELLALIDPGLRLVMIDGRGIAEQSIDLRSSGQVDAQGLVYDALGFPAYDKNPVYVPVAQDGDWIAGGTTNYLPPVGGEPQTLDHYLAYGNGSPFVRSALEPSPLARLQKVGQPGDALAIGGGHETQFAYAQNTASGPMAGIVPDQYAGNYHLITATTPDSTTLYTLTSPDGNTIARRVKLSGSTSLTYRYQYNGAGRLVAIVPPSAPAQVSGTGGSTWDTTYTRDFLGRVTAVTSPDAGTAQYAPDSLGRVRFTMDAAGAAQTPPRISYSKYDGLNRVVETGTIADATVTWASVQSHVDDPTWPGTGVSSQVGRVFVYDAGSGTLVGTYTEGRLTQVTTYKAAAVLGVRETYSYDTHGNVVTYWAEAPDYDSTIWVSAYTYDSRNRLVQLDYPKATTDGSPPLRVTYTYDRLGRVAAVGAPYDPNGDLNLADTPADFATRYGMFGYNPDNTVSVAGYNNHNGNSAITVQYTYSAAGWPLTVTSPVYSETVTYANGGYGSAGYYNGLVASVQATWQKGKGELYPLLDYTAQYAYDAAGRITAATPYLAPPTAGGQSTPALQYDGNSNLLTVQRGAAVASYSYPSTGVSGTLQGSEGTSTTPSDQLQVVTTTLATTCSFETTSPPQGWGWGTANGGPGGATIVDGGPPGSTKCLNLPGGAAGAANCLGYSGQIDPNGQLAVSYWLKADAAFASQKGWAGWFLTLNGPEGILAEIKVGDIAPSTTWEQKTFTINMQSCLQGQAAYARVTQVLIALCNQKMSSDGSPGAAIQVDNVALTGTSTTGSLVYDASGRTTAIPRDGLSAMTYAASATALVAYQSAAMGGFQVGFALNGDDLYTTRTATPTGGGTPVKSLILRDPLGRALVQYDSTNGTVRRRYFIAGDQGIFAVEDDGVMCYLVNGHDGLVRAVSDNQGQLVQYFDYDAFGVLQRSVGGTPLGTDPLTGLDLSAGGVYDPSLGRNLAPLANPCPNQATAPVAGGYWEGWWNWTREKIPQPVATLSNIVWLHFVESHGYMQHAPEVWGLHGQPLSPSDWAVIGMVLGAGVGLPVLGGAAIGLAAYNVPAISGLRRYFSERSVSRQCQNKGLYGVLSEALVEDIYHWQQYGPIESIEGAQILRDKAVGQIADGTYIFTVTENDAFRYRDVLDRTIGTQLYVRHSMLNSGECAKTAGIFSIDNTTREIILTNQSGHYGPSLDSIEAHARRLLLKAGYVDYTFWVCDYMQLNLVKRMKNRTKPPVNVG